MADRALGFRGQVHGQGRATARPLAAMGPSLRGGAAGASLVAVWLACGPVAAADEGTERSVPWNVGVTVTAYFQGRDSLVQPTAAVDHGGLHLEGRYNYEALQTGSLWVGWNLGWGKSLQLALTPMLGGVFGSENGVAPGLEFTLSWGPMQLSSQDEFVFNLSDWGESDFYSWSQLTGSPVGWLQTGLALQRTRLVSTSRVVQWGPLVGVQIWKLNGSIYWFDPGQVSQYWVASVEAAF